MAPVYPTPETVAPVRDKLTQKQHLVRAGIPAVEFQKVTSPVESGQFAQRAGFPILLKTRLFGYDGYGNRTVERLKPSKAHGQSFGSVPQGRACLPSAGFRS